MVVLGTTTMPIHQVMRLSRGAIIELDATEADEVKILANNLPIASGVVLVDRNRIAVEVKQMLSKSPAPARPPLRDGILLYFHSFRQRLMMRRQALSLHP